MTMLANKTDPKVKKILKRYKEKLEKLAYEEGDTVTEALDAFHSSVPIGCLDDFEVRTFLGPIEVFEE